MIRFEMEEEYMAALTGGPWRVFENYLLLQAWSPEFDPTRDDIVTTPVWVRISSLPVNYYHRSILMGIAKGLGRPLRVDLTTARFERARFARVCVEVNLKKSLKGTIMINGDRYFVAYEGLTKICSGCGVYGHMVHQCPRGFQDKTTTTPVSPVGEVSPMAAIVPAEEGFIQVRRNGKKLAKSPLPEGPTAGGRGGVDRHLREISHGENSGKVELANRFGSLDSDTGSLELREEVVMTEANKENEISVNRGRESNQAKSGPQGTAVVFGAGSGHVLKGNKEGKKVIRPGSSKLSSSHGSRPNSLQTGRPTKGLIFGPTFGDKELSSSGKRLRIERESYGRAGGIFVTNNNGLREVEKKGSGKMEAGQNNNLQMIEQGISLGDSMQRDPPPREAESQIA